ncbi:hypothetical protein EYF80_054423 [Liparis tanakae]|uniref:Uncharacterized protein n=1 Tax=Liparis tanakae TaxID=230148 RepID=A0A4Z2F2G5_9TELE|nr:hypothetical protein EYF80_054423 [Liparis tanakae]
MHCSAVVAVNLVSRIWGKWSRKSTVWNGDSIRTPSETRGRLRETNHNRGAEPQENHQTQRDQSQRGGCACGADLRAPTVSVSTTRLPALLDPPLSGPRAQRLTGAAQGVDLPAHLELGEVHEEGLGEVLQSVGGGEVRDQTPLLQREGPPCHGVRPGALRSDGPVLTCSWYSSTGISSVFGGPNCLLVAEKRMATVRASFRLTCAIRVMDTRPPDRAPSDSPKRLLGSWRRGKMET